MKKKLKLKMTFENLKYLLFLKKIAKEVDTWPEWKKIGIIYEKEETSS